MNKTYLLAIAAALIAAPLAFAHPDGTVSPKTQCESGTETSQHDYGAPSTGFVIFLGLDASIPPCPYGDTTWDGHLEWAFGGAWLQAAASVCTDAYADHTPGALISVEDAVLTALGSDVAFSVYADTLNNDPVPSEPNCGDFESDYGVDCVNSCAPGFPPGLDGSYQVYVSGTSGHINSNSVAPPVCTGLPGTFSLLPSTSNGFVARGANCQAVQVTTSPWVTVVFQPGGETCLVLVTGTCSFPLGSTGFEIVAGPLLAVSGSWVQV